MNAIMVYMTGNSVQIFSVMITAMLFFQPVKAIMSLQQSECEREAGRWERRTKAEQH